MTEYLIAFNDESVPDHTVEERREKSTAVRALLAEMTAAGSSSSPAAWTMPPPCSASMRRAGLAAGGATLPGAHAAARPFLTGSTFLRRGSTTSSCGPPVVAADPAVGIR